MEPKSPSKSKLPVMGFIHHNRRVLKIGTLVFVLVLFMFIGLYFMFIKLDFGENGSKWSVFAVVLDCGSTGTRVNVYEWRTQDNIRTEGLPALMRTYPDYTLESDDIKGGCRYHCMQTEPGLDKFVSNASGVRVSVEPLIRRAEKWVPLDRHRDTPIFVLATAGLRRLPIKDARQVLENVEAVVSEHEFMHRKSWIRVLTGQEEAYYGWVALNYKMGIFQNLLRLPTLGVLDLGGSSLQVVSETGELTDNENVFRSKIGSVEYQVLAYSLPTFGLNAAFDRSVIMLSHTHALREIGDGSFEVTHPCFSSGFLQNYTCGGCLGVNITNSENMNGQMRGNELSSLYLAGEPNWEKCKLLSRAAATNSSSSDWSQLTARSNCIGTKLLNLTVSTGSNARFHALSGFFAVYNMLNLSSGGNLTKIWEKGKQLCSRSSAYMTSTSGSQTSAGQYCFKVAYLMSLIEDTLCLGGTEIVFGPGDISWTLGAALVEGKYLWHGRSSNGHEILNMENRGRVLSPIFLFVILVCLLFIVYCSQIKLPMPSRKGASRHSFSTIL